MVVLFVGYDDVIITADGAIGAAGHDFHGASAVLDLELVTPCIFHLALGQSERLDGGLSVTVCFALHGHVGQDLVRSHFGAVNIGALTSRVDRDHDARHDRRHDGQNDHDFDEGHTAFRTCGKSHALT